MAIPQRNGILKLFIVGKGGRGEGGVTIPVRATIQSYEKATLSYMTPKHFTSSYLGKHFLKISLPPTLIHKQKH